MTPHAVVRQFSLSFTVSQSLFKLMSIESVMPSYHRMLCHPHLLLPSNIPSIRVFSKESALRIRCGKIIGASASSSILPVNSKGWLPRLGLTGLMSFQSKGLSRVFSRKVSILQHSAFCMVEISHPYMTAGKTIALTTWTFVSKVMSLIFNTLSRSVIAFQASFSFMAAITIISHH